MDPREFVLKRAQRMAAATEGVVLSPCISVCYIDQANGFCAGCFRTLDEVSAWSTMPDGEKREVWKRIAQRISA